MSGIELVFLAGFVVLVIVIYAIKESRLSDPENLSFIPVTQMREVASIEIGPVAAELIRQSGNSYKPLGQFQSSTEAFAEIEKSFRRAKIDSVAVVKNTPTLFQVIRLHHSHGGRAEGKKLGGAIIQKI